jgi:hypothetical protein
MPPVSKSVTHRQPDAASLNDIAGIARPAPFREPRSTSGRSGRLTLSFGDELEERALDRRTCLLRLARSDRTCLLRLARSDAADRYDATAFQCGGQRRAGPANDFYRPVSTVRLPVRGIAFIAGHLAPGDRVGDEA